MKKINTFVLLAFTSVIFLNAGVFPLTEKVIVLFKQDFDKRVLDKIKNDNVLKKALSPSIKILSVPTCFVDPDQISNHDPSNISEKIEIDSTSMYGFLRNSKEEVIGTVYNYYALSYNIGKEQNKSNKWDFKMVDLVYHKYSKNPFLISFSDLDTNKVVGFFKDGDLQFLNRELRVITDLNFLIIQQNGSLEKYFEIMDLKRLKRNLLRKISTLENAKNFLKRDYITYMSYFPNDTIKVLDLLLNEMQETSQISIEQRNLVQKQIFLAKKKHHLLPFAGSGLPFYEQDIANCVQSVLTRKQYSTFMEQRELNSYLTTQASNKIYSYLFKKKNIPQDKILEEFKREIFD